MNTLNVRSAIELKHGSFTVLALPLKQRIYFPFKWYHLNVFMLSDGYNRTYHMTRNYKKKKKKKKKKKNRLLDIIFP